MATCKYQLRNRVTVRVHGPKTVQMRGILELRLMIKNNNEFIRTKSFGTTIMTKHRHTIPEREVYSLRPSAERRERLGKWEKSKTTQGSRVITALFSLLIDLLERCASLWLAGLIHAFTERAHADGSIIYLHCPCEGPQFTSRVELRFCAGISSAGHDQE